MSDIQNHLTQRLQQRKLHVRVRSDAFTKMLEALEFYARSGTDNGERAKQVMDQRWGEQSA